MDTTPEPSTSNPTDTALTAADDLLAAGHGDGQFRAVEGAQVECLTCHRTGPATGYPADDATRLEGASDPDDMLMVVPVRCPGCTTRGTLIVGYGPNASAEDSDALGAMQPPSR